MKNRQRGLILLSMGWFLVFGMFAGLLSSSVAVYTAYELSHSYTAQRVVCEFKSTIGAENYYVCVIPRYINVFLNRLVRDR